MILKRKSFTKKDDRDKKDKSWDSVYGAGIGSAAGSTIGLNIGKAIEDDGRFDRELTEKDIRKDAEKRNNKIYKEYDKSIKNIKSNPNIDPGSKERLVESYEKARGDSLSKNNQTMNKRLKNLKKRRLKGNPIKVKRKLALSIAAGGAVVGSILGSLYGRDNDLRKQRRKMEDAAGDKVAESIKKIGNKKEDEK